MHFNCVDITGKKYNKMTAIAIAPTRLTSGGKRVSQWVFRCDCGKVVTKDKGSVTRGLQKTCGCKIDSKAITHGKTKTSEYGIWQQMKKRCHNSNGVGHHRYQGRGIKVCDRWRESFENFYEDMGDRPSNRHSIDRVDNDGDYEKGNCRWATVSEQSNNKSTNIYHDFLGQKMTLSQLLSLTDVSKTELHRRLNSGMSVYMAITKPTKKRAICKTN